jgi:hypothetical protein
VKRGKLIRSRDNLLNRELLFAMERARSRLAVAIAAETKRTSRERWRHYLETADRIRRCVRQIRQGGVETRAWQFGCLEALDLLTRPLPEEDPEIPSEAFALCQRLYTVLEIMEAAKMDK